MRRVPILYPQCRRVFPKDYYCAPPKLDTFSVAWVVCDASSFKKHSDIASRLFWFKGVKKIYRWILNRWTPHAIAQQDILPFHIAISQLCSVLLFFITNNNTTTNRRRNTERQRIHQRCKTAAVLVPPARFNRIHLSLLTLFGTSGYIIVHTRVRDKIMVRCITEMLVAMVHIRIMTLMRPLFTPALISFNKI